MMADQENKGNQIVLKSTDYLFLEGRLNTCGSAQFQGNPNITNIWLEETRIIQNAPSCLSTFNTTAQKKKQPAHKRVELLVIVPQSNKRQ